MEDTLFLHASLHRSKAGKNVPINRNMFSMGYSIVEAERTFDGPPRALRPTYWHDGGRPERGAEASTTSRKSVPGFPPGSVTFGREGSYRLTKKTCRLRLDRAGAARVQVRKKVPPDSPGRTRPEPLALQAGTPGQKAAGPAISFSQQRDSAAQSCTVHQMGSDRDRFACHVNPWSAMNRVSSRLFMDYQLTLWNWRSVGGTLALAGRQIGGRVASA